jgi:hypothetical protein
MGQEVSHRCPILDTCRSPCAYAWGASQIPLPQEVPRSLSESLCRKDLKVKRISNPVDNVKIRADIDSILNSLVAHSRHAHRSNIILLNFSGSKRQLFQKCQRSPQIYIDRCCVPIGQYSLDDGITQGFRRDRAVTPRSKRTLVLA